MPFDVDSGRLVGTARPHTATARPLRPPGSDRHSAQRRPAARVTGAGRRRWRGLDIAARSRAAAEQSAAGHPVAEPASGSGIAGAFWSATGDPQIIVDLGAAGSARYMMELELEVVRDWKRRQGI